MNPAPACNKAMCQKDGFQPQADPSSGGITCDFQNSSGLNTGRGVC